MNNQACLDRLEACLDVLRPRMATLCAQDFGGHDIDHSERTLRMALILQQHEGGDPVVIGLGAYLHDIHRVLEHGAGAFVSPTESLVTVRELLDLVDVSPQEADQICYCVQHHEDYSWNGSAVEDLNARIVQDADNLEAVGALGVARAMYYGSSTGVPMFDASVPLVAKADYAESSEHDPSVIHHFQNKALRLAESMHTNTARQIARQRIAYMQTFVDQFLVEWQSADMPAQS